MPTTETYWCTNCQGYYQAWNDYPTRCWKCDKYTLQRGAVITQNTSSSTISTTEPQRRQVAHEVARYARETDQAFEYKIEVRDERGRAVAQSFKSWPKQ
jgi:hypothetical protein